jgi:hypothetical protein
MCPISEGLRHRPPAPPLGQGNGEGVENTPGVRGMSASPRRVIFLRGLDTLSDLEAVLEARC